MRVLVAPDSFKESLGAVDAARAIAAGLVSVDRSIEIDLAPIADGGEGTVEAVVVATGGERVRRAVDDPLGRPVEAVYGRIDGRTAILEMAAASGLALLVPAERDPLLTSTVGTGQLLADAAAGGATRILLGIGGSATVDGGAGALVGLGYRFLDSRGRVVEPVGGRLVDVAAIEVPASPPLAGVEIEILCDVDNPLLGPDGAAPVYGPQKGATPAAVARLEEGLARLAACYADAFGRPVADLPGAGAAGGLGAGLAAAFGARLVPGFDALAALVDLERRVAGADLIVSGEGRLDRTSAMGKVLSGLGGLAARHRKPLVALVGCLGEGAEAILEAGVTAYFPIVAGPVPLDEALAAAAAGLTRTAAMVVRLLKKGPRPL